MSGAGLRRLLPRSLAGQLIALLLLALIAAQLISLMVFVGERRAALQSANRVQVISRVETMVRLLAAMPAEMEDQLLLTASSSDLRLWLTDESAIAADTVAGRGERLRRILVARLADTGVRAVRVTLSSSSGALERPPGSRYGPRSRPRVGPGWPDGGRSRPGAGLRGGPPPFGPLDMTLSIDLGDGRWLNAVTRPSQDAEWATAFLVSLISAAVALVGIVFFTVRRLTQPLAALAAAADKVGRGEDAPALVERGPEDVRRTTRAFNRMQDRLHRYVQDRLHMLAAISHDLRSPITVLRLRAEFIDDEETKDKVLATLDDMEAITEATLTFAREEGSREATRTLDMTALAEAVCADFIDSGADVSVAVGERVVVRGRSSGLKRAVRNLVENAVAYGTRARVTIASDPDAVSVVVEDDGPGITDVLHERVFAPFYRVETSRSRETGGVGLGLAIARTIARAHGGDVILRTSAAGKFQVVLSLPVAHAVAGADGR